MKNLDLSAMKMLPVSRKEAMDVQGGNFWGRLKIAVRCVSLVAEMLLLDPIKHLGDGFSKGLERGIQ